MIGCYRSRRVILNEAADVTDAANAAETTKAIVSNKAGEADDAFKSDAANETIAIDRAVAVDSIQSDVANEAIAIDRAVAVDRANTNICRSLLIDGIAIFLYLVFSLTKYSVIFTEVEGYFGIDGCNNQLAGMIQSYLRSLRFRLNNKLVISLEQRIWR